MLLVEILVAIIVGILVGIISGLTPGIHINMISLLVLTLSPILIIQYNVNPLTLCVFIISMGVIHTFLDAIPSIYLGAPNEDTALGVLPGHRYLLRGNGLMAVKLFTLGSFFGLVAGVIMFPILYYITKYSYPLLENYFGWILLFVLLFMIFRDEKKWWAIIVVIMSGCFGMIVFNLDMKDCLFPMLSGLFGISTLIISLADENNIPVQNDETSFKLERKQSWLSIIFGNFSAFIVSTFPGLSGSIAALISMQFVKDLGDKGFMILMGCIGTSSFVLSLVALYTVDKARNGAVIVVASLMKVDLITVMIFLSVALIAGAAGVYLSMKTGRIFSRLISRVNYKMLAISIIILVTGLVIIMTGWIGLLVLFTSTAIGLIPGIVKVQRTHSMSCLIVPVIVFLL